MHRDYGISASSLISIYPDRMEFVSVGGLLPDIDLEDVLVGLSVCRNQNLANVFYRLRLIEAYGTGIHKMMKAYDGTGKTPLIETTSHAFKITLPNINYVAELQKAAPASLAGSEEAPILGYVKQNGGITRADVENLLSVSASSASRILRRMVANGQLVQQGKARNIRYILAGL